MATRREAVTPPGVGCGQVPSCKPSLLSRGVQSYLRGEEKSCRSSCFQGCVGHRALRGTHTPLPVLLRLLSGLDPQHCAPEPAFPAVSRGGWGRDAARINAR